VSRVASLHTRRIKGALLPLLGADFMESLYRQILEMDSFQVYAYCPGDQVLGFICATDCRRGAMARLAGGIPWPGIKGLGGLFLRSPLQAIRLISTLLYPAVTGGKPQEGGELLFIALEEEALKKGISDRLVAESLRWLQSRGVSQAVVTADADNTGACRLLERMGFRLLWKFIFRGVDTCMFVKEITDIEGLQQESE